MSSAVISEMHGLLRCISGRAKEAIARKDSLSEGLWAGTLEGALSDIIGLVHFFDGDVVTHDTSGPGGMDLEDWYTGQALVGITSAPYLRSDETIGHRARGIARAVMEARPARAKKASGGVVQ